MDKLTWIILVGFTIFEAHLALPPSLRYPIPIAINRILSINASCDSKNINATIRMQHPFKGLLFAKDFSQGCKSVGTLQNSVNINLPTSGCGVRLSSKVEEGSEKQVMFYSVTLVAQQDRHLRQISDTERVVECVIKDDTLAIKSQPMMDAVENEILQLKRRSERTGRMKGGFSNEELQDAKSDVEIGSELTNALDAARAWMEINPEDGELRNSENLQVGETALLTVKSTLPAGIGWKVVDCIAHDGLGDSSQKLLDEQGCPLDELLLPIPEMGPIQKIHLMRHQEAVSRFAAFKFPDRDRLHLSCGLLLCRGFCLEIDCQSNTSEDSIESRLARTLSKGQQGEVLDRLEIFNSVEVLAPDIELDERNSEKSQAVDTSPFGNLPGDRTFCVSPDKMAITFCILGVVFLVAVIVAVVALMRARRSGEAIIPYYTRSLFSSSSGASAYGGSKLLLRDSPCMGQSSSSRSLPYGRMF